MAILGHLNRQRGALGIMILLIVTGPSLATAGDCRYWECWRTVDTTICGEVFTEPQPGDKWAADCRVVHDCDWWTGYCHYWCEYDLCYDV